MPDTMTEPPLQPLNAAVIPRFAEAATFMRTPRVNDATKVDIALVGVPFDLGTGFRTGARQGPAQIREMSRIIRRSRGVMKRMATPLRPARPVRPMRCTYASTSFGTS